MKGQSACRVGDLCEQIRGVTYSKADAVTSPSPGYKPVLRANNITDFGLHYRDLVYVPESRISPRQYVKANDIVIAASSGSLDVVGKAARALADFDGGFGAFCKVLRPNEQVDPGYFAHFFQTRSYRQKISSLAAGANINNLRNNHLDNLEILLPSLPEQRRIAAILDKADALRSKRREAIAKLDQLLQSVFLDMFGDPATNPKGWDTATFGEILKVKSGNGLTAQSMNPGGEFPVYGGNGISGCHDEYMFDEPQLVIGRVGVYCGVVHLTKPKSWVTDNALYVSNLLKPIDQTFLKAILIAANFNQYAGQAAQPLVSGSRIYPVGTILPPISLQREYAAFAQGIEQQKRKLKQHAEQQDLLFANLQHRAFSGTL